MDNRSTIVYTMNKEMFKYHISKSELKKGSSISKRIHPLDEVNKFRERLLNRKLLLDVGKYYILKNTIRVGATMAYNLHCGEFKSEIESNNDIEVNCLDKKVIEEFDMKNIYSTDAILRNSLSLDSMELVGLKEIEIDFSVLSDSNPDNFSKLEKIFCDVLIQEKIISPNARHGLTSNGECDIVDDSRGVQIEIVAEFKNRLKKDKTPQRNIDMFMIEAVDNNLIKTSAALIKKFSDKNYTSNFEIELGIFCVGSKSSVKTMLEVLKEKMKKIKLKNDYKKIHILWYDFITNKYYLYSSYGNLNKELQDLNLGLVKMKDVDLVDMHDGKKYLMVLKNIFGKEGAISYLEKKDILNRVKELRTKIEAYNK